MVMSSRLRGGNRYSVSWLIVWTGTTDKFITVLAQVNGIQAELSIWGSRLTWLVGPDLAEIVEGC